MSYFQINKKKTTIQSKNLFAIRHQTITTSDSFPFETSKAWRKKLFFIFSINARISQRFALVAHNVNMILMKWKVQYNLHYIEGTPRQ